MLFSVECHRCGGAYKVPPHRLRRTRYCSLDCTKLPPKPCEECGLPIKRRPGRRRFCSRACAVRAMVGPKASVWKGGVSIKDERGRLGRKLAAWRLAVFARDNWTCRHCGRAKVALHAHHVKGFADHPRLRLAVSNGLTLCEACHGKVHGKVFSHRVRRRTCRDCGTLCSGRGSGRCRPCSIKRWHALGRPAACIQPDGPRLRRD